MKVLRLIALEDRIVYDGAIAHDAAPPVPASGFVSAPQSAHNEPPPPPNVLVIADTLPYAPTVLQAAKGDTKIVHYDPATTSLEQLAQQINHVLPTSLPLMFHTLWNRRYIDNRC